LTHTHTHTHMHMHIHTHTHTHLHTHIHTHLVFFNGIHGSMRFENGMLAEILESQAVINSCSILHRKLTFQNFLHLRVAWASLIVLSKLPHHPCWTINQSKSTLNLKIATARGGLPPASSCWIWLIYIRDMTHILLLDMAHIYKRHDSYTYI
jgi:hypothetical protein